MRLRSGAWLQEVDGTGRMGNDTTLIRCVLERLADPVALATCMKVCRSWRSVAGDIYAWKKLVGKGNAPGDFTEPLRLALQKNRETPVPSFVFSSLLDEDAKRRLLTNRCLLLTKDSQDCAWREVDRSASSGDSALSRLRSVPTLDFDDLIFTLDILVDGDLRSSTCFERGTANAINVLRVDLLVGEASPGGAACLDIHKSIAQRGMYLLNLVQETIEVKVSAVRRNDLRMTQIFSYDTSHDSKFNWDLSWDIDADEEEDIMRGVVCQASGDFLDDWSLWLYSNLSDHPGRCQAPKHSFLVSNPRGVFDHEAMDLSSDTSDSDGVGGTQDHQVVCDVKLNLVLRPTPEGFTVSVDDAAVMEFCHYWTSGEGNTYYVEVSQAKCIGFGLGWVCRSFGTDEFFSSFTQLTDRAFLSCLEYERLWI